MRPAKLLAQDTYPASSNFRAWTLRLPSEVSSSFFSSMKVSDSFTVSALRIPRRRRSWTRRSNLEASPTDSKTGRFSRSRRIVFALPAIFHRDHGSKNHMQSAEANRQQHSVPSRQQERHRTHEHETCAHHGHDPYRCRSAGKHRGAIEQQPHTRQKSRDAGAVEHRRENRSGEEGGSR